jgi:hypothetical protein
MKRTVIIAASLIIAVLLIAVATSNAARNPTKPEKRKIARVLERKGFDCSFVAGGCHRKIKVSTKLETWAAAYIRGSGVQGAVASLHRKNHKWRVHQIGNGGGCGVPRKVRKDLKLACY